MECLAVKHTHPNIKDEDVENIIKSTTREVSAEENRQKYNSAIDEEIGQHQRRITEIEGRPHPDVILISDTKIDNPYNTYKWAGLPPGPISNPGLIALDAATNTPKTNYYFFQVVDPSQGRHVFTSTFEEHKVNKLYTKKAAGR